MRHHATTQLHNLTESTLKVRFHVVCSTSDGYTGLKRADPGEWTGRASTGTCAEPWQTVDIKGYEQE